MLHTNDIIRTATGINTNNKRIVMTICGIKELLAYYDGFGCKKVTKDLQRLLDMLNVDNDDRRTTF
ncbi:hypothetical protein C4J81_00315 [Deltaproteobacteria bacterium Smac51]|nr:hypothetical protein C4J81_00235 [Deltaproteobacteria bacterium Smac51]UQZ87742.1 hypothetical protein C4J81_00315 [Deltaproteobacteria bacterium Smac51]